MDVFFNNSLLANCLLNTSLIGAAMGAVGAFTFLRRESLLGDVLAHSALPGIMISILWHQAITPLIILGGGALSGALGVILVTLITNMTPTKKDTAMGVVLSVFFGMGLILITVAQKQTLPSPALVETFLFGNAATLLPSDMMLIQLVTLIIIFSLLILWRPLYLVSFDSQFSRTISSPVISATILFYFLLILVTVTGLQTIGVILSSMFLVAPGAAARQWTKHLHTTVLLSAFFGSMSGFLGTYASSYSHTVPTGPAIVLVLSFIVATSLVCGKHKKVCIQ